MTATTARLPRPSGTPGLGHMWRWATDPVRLLEAGAGTGEVFRLRLWRPVVVGYRPDWNRAVLGDLDTFRSRGSLSGLTPYLSGGVVHTDVPEHAGRRRELNPHFHARSLDAALPSLDAAVHARLPNGPFEALTWSGAAVRSMLNAAFFAGQFPDPLLARYVAPLHRPNPAPLLPRPVLFRQVDAEIRRLLAAPPPAGTLAAAMAGMTGNAVEEVRVALAAGYDTTAHTLAWALWHLASAPQWRTLDTQPLLLDEVLRLYPAGWIGSRVARVDAAVCGVEIAAGTMVLYSPYLTHRDPDLWPEPGLFRPERFRQGRPAWGFIPFSAGRRTCLGAHLARHMLRCALRPFYSGRLVPVHGDPAIRSSITLRPHGPLWISWSP